MSTESNKEIVRRFHDIMNSGRLEELSEVVADDFVEETPPPGQEQGLDGLRRWFEQVRAAYPDMRTEVQEMVAEGDNVAVRAYIDGTHQGPIFGIEPTGKHMRVETWNVVRLRDGKISRTRFLMDTGSLLEQLGIAPAAPGA